MTDEKLNVEDVLKAKQKELAKELAAIEQKQKEIAAKKEAEAKAKAEEEARKRREAEEKRLADWGFVCRISGASIEPTGLSMTTVELRQHKKSGKVEVFVV